MAHIASCLLDADEDDFSFGLNNYIAKAVSPQEPNESVCNHVNSPATNSVFLLLAEAHSSLLCS